MLRAERKRLKAEYSLLFEELTAILFRIDPVGIADEENFDEYEPEVGTILPRLSSAGSAEDVKEIIRQEFTNWFGNTTYAKTKLDDLALEFWEAWMKHKNSEH